MNTSTQQLEQVLSQSGVVFGGMKLSVARLNVMLNPEDLGLAQDDKNFKKFISGRKKLLASKADTLQPFATLESRKAAILRNLPELLGARFVPNGMLAKVRADLDKVKSDFYEQKASWMPHFGEYRDAAIEEWKEWIKETGLPDGTLGRIEAAFPSEAKLDSKFGVTGPYFYEVKTINGDMSQLLVDGAKAQEAAEARAKAAQEGAQVYRDEIVSFANEAVSALRQEVVHVSQQMLATIQAAENGVNQKTINRMNTLWEYFRSMNFVGDASLEELIKSARDEICGHTAEQYRNNSSWHEELVSNIKLVGDAAEALSKQDTTELVNRWASGAPRKLVL